MLDSEEYSKFAKCLREMEKASRVSVAIPYDEVDKLVISQLMSRYNHPGNHKSRDLLKAVLTTFYLTEDEFEQMIDIRF